jgi:hypothetical protein
MHVRNEARGAKCDLVVLDVGRPAQRNVWDLR